MVLDVATSMVQLALQIYQKGCKKNVIRPMYLILVISEQNAMWLPYSYFVKLQPALKEASEASQPVTLDIALSIKQ